MKKSLLIILGCIISVILFQAFTTSSNEPHWKNLKILPQDISQHDLDTVMHHFTAALGVKCNFCHVRNEDQKKMDFASDDKPEKNIARKMMSMAIDLNKNYFKGMDHHDMDHDMDKDADHDMNKGSTHDHDMDKDMDHNNMDTSMNMEPAKYMLRTVTCFTCHRGDAHPESKIPPHQEGPRPPEPPKPAENK
jgi:Photosynthetic reaction centre cytochrome C subunit.